MDHLSARISLLVMIGHGDTVKFGLRVVAHQYAGGVFPRNGRACLHLRPREFAVGAAQLSSFSHEIIYATTAFAIAGIPILYRTVFYFCIFLHDDFYNGGVQLVLVALWCSATFQIRDIAAVFADDQRALKLSGVACIDAEIRR